MTVEIIFLAIFVLSLCGALFILARKIPSLASLPHNGSIGIKKSQFIIDIEDQIGEIVNAFEKQILLHKFLSKVKVLTLKTETVIDKLLRDIRKKAQQKDKKNK